MFCFGQVNVLFHTGVGTYRMKEQKELQDDFLKSGLPWRPVHEFPPYWNFGGSLSFPISPKLQAGGWIEYGSTGGTLHYADYSGSARLDQLLRYTQFGGFLSVRINTRETWPIYFTSHVSIAKTKENLNYQIIIGTSTDEDSQLYTSTNFGFRPGLMIERTIKAWVFQTSLGIEMQVPGILHNTKTGSPLINNDGDFISAQWAGIRAQFGAGFRLGGKNRQLQKIHSN
jgi:hypothetical protein